MMHLNRSEGGLAEMVRQDLSDPRTNLPRAEARAARDHQGEVCGPLASGLFGNGEGGPSRGGVGAMGKGGRVQRLL